MNKGLNVYFLYIYVLQSKNSKKYHRDSQYIINAKSSINTATLLLSGQVYNAKSKENLTDHYIIEEVKHREILTITARSINCLNPMPFPWKCFLAC